MTNETINYTYYGNVITVTDTAGIWKQYFNDVFGNLVTVIEPDPYVVKSGSEGAGGMLALDA
jgi:hypothetical protein